MKHVLGAVFSGCLFFLAGCAHQAASPANSAAGPGAVEQVEGPSLDAILAMRGSEVKARDSYRHPRETLEFFGIKPGMKIAELLPGHGWYTQILAPLVGPEGAVYGIYYDEATWRQFGYSDEVVAERLSHVHEFAEMVESFPGTEGVTAQSYTLSSIDEDLNGTLDAVLFIRALHALHYFEKVVGTNSLTSMMQRTAELLKPGGIVCVVQHRAQPELSDDLAQGNRGYLKESTVIDVFEEAGFELVATSEINNNPKDRPSADEVVWRLPPTLRVDPELKEEMLAIGESDRITLLFRKP